MQTIRFDFIYECLANWSATNVRDIHLDWIHSSAFNYFKFNSSFDANVLSFKLKPQLTCFNPWNLILNALQTSSDANEGIDQQVSLSFCYSALPARLPKTLVYCEIVLWMRVLDSLNSFTDSFAES